MPDCPATNVTAECRVQLGPGTTENYVEARAATTLSRPHRSLLCKVVRLPSAHSCDMCIGVDCRYPAIGFQRLLAERYPPYSFAKCKNVGASGGWSHQFVHGLTMHRGVGIVKSLSPLERQCNRFGALRRHAPSFCSCMRANKPSVSAWCATPWWRRSTQAPRCAAWARTKKRPRASTSPSRWRGRSAGPACWASAARRSAPFSSARGRLEEAHQLLVEAHLVLTPMPPGVTVPNPFNELALVRLSWAALSRPWSR